MPGPPIKSAPRAICGEVWWLQYATQTAPPHAGVEHQRQQGARQYPEGMKDVSRWRRASQGRGSITQTTSGAIRDLPQRMVRRHPLIRRNVRRQPALIRKPAAPHSLRRFEMKSGSSGLLDGEGSFGLEPEMIHLLGDRRYRCHRVVAARSLRTGSHANQSRVKLPAPFAAREPHVGFLCEAAPLPVSMTTRRYRPPRSCVRFVEASVRLGLRGTGVRR